MKVSGKVILLNDNIDTDQIYPGRYLPLTEPDEMAEHAFEGIISDFSDRAEGSIIVAGKNFGCGSSREQAATCLKYSQIAGIVAESFARIFFRNAINQGLPIMIAPGVKEKISDGDELEVDFRSGDIRDMSKDVNFKGEPLPEFLLKIIECGGLIERVKSKLGGKR